MPETGSQTLARGLTVLDLIGEAESPPTVADVAARLGVHRSMAYRLVRTLEEFGFVARTAGGALEIGARALALARGVARDLRSAAAPELSALADELGMTVFLVVYDGSDAVTLTSAEPRRADATVGQRPGSRHPTDRGAPGRVIRSQLDPAAHPPEPYETSSDEVFAGLSSVAVPLVTPTGQPVSLAAVYLTQEIDVTALVAALGRGAERISRALR